MQAGGLLGDVQTLEGPRHPLEPRRRVPGRDCDGRYCPRPTCDRTPSLPCPPLGAGPRPRTPRHGSPWTQPVTGLPGCPSSLRLVFKSPRLPPKARREEGGGDPAAPKAAHLQHGGCAFLRQLCLWCEEIRTQVTIRAPCAAVRGWGWLGVCGGGGGGREQPHGQGNLGAVVRGCDWGESRGHQGQGTLRPGGRGSCALGGFSTSPPPATGMGSMSHPELPAPGSPPSTPVPLRIPHPRLAA